MPLHLGPSVGPLRLGARSRVLYSSGSIATSIGTKLLELALARTSVPAALTYWVCPNSVEGHTPNLSPARFRLCFQHAGRSAGQLPADCALLDQSDRVGVRVLGRSVVRCAPRSMQLRQLYPAFLLAASSPSHTPEPAEAGQADRHTDTLAQAGVRLASRTDPTL